jgi:hypothetical protein
VTTDFVLLIYLAVIGSLIGMPLIVAFRQVRLERRRIMADGTQAAGQITAIKARTNGQAIVNFTFDLTGAGKPVTGRQVTSKAAVRQRGLMPGSSVTVHYLPKWARWGFIPALTYVERIPVTLQTGVWSNGGFRPLNSTRRRQSMAPRY